MGDTGNTIVCASTQHLCSGTCVDNTSIQNCGTRCSEPCTAPTGGTATCDGTTCSFSCSGTTPKMCAIAMTCIASSGCCTNADCPAMSGGQTGTCDSGTSTCNYGCPSNTQSCTTNGTTSCIAAGGCCKDSDCAGSCMTCNMSTHACGAAKSEDDPTGRCAGTCDASGTCKSKQGQTCNTVSGSMGGCVTGTTCSPDGYCCNTTCTGSCVACDLQGFEGTCTNLASGTAPHSNHPLCTGAGTSCAGSCGSAGACTYPTSSCGAAPTCSGTSYVSQATCSNGSCGTTSPQTCSGDFVCSLNTCKTSCTADSDCLPGYFCETGLCHLGAVAITAGSSHTCALLSDGSIRCWGDDGVGELGNGIVLNNGVNNVPTPVSVTGLPKPATSVAAGGGFTCSLLTDGSAWCWGSDGDGALAITPVIGTDPTPTKVVGLSGPATAIALGTGHACAISTGNIWCWGYDAVGQLGNGESLGNGNTNFVATPTEVMGLAGATLVAAGEIHTCAVAAGDLYCWGDDYDGQLGNGQVRDSNAGQESYPTPQSVSVPTPILAVAAGNDHSCVLVTAGNIYCWGQNSSGQLGNGTFAGPGGSGQTTLIPTPEPVTGMLSGPTSVVAGGDQACALNFDGSIACWGHNGEGELGNGNTNDQDSAVKVVGLPAAAIAVTAGDFHTCAVLKNGSAWCWGTNSAGQLGNGTTTASSTPVEVAGW